MVKQRWRIILFSIILSICTGIFTYGEEKTRIEQVQVNLPDVDVYFYAPQKTEESIQAIEGMLNYKSLTLNQITRVGEAYPGTHYYFLVDCSTSTRENQMQAVKETLSHFLTEMKAEDTISLITFGLQVEVILDREQNSEIQKSAIDALSADQKGTLFFDAIAKTVELADKKEIAGQRKLAFLFSDSIDVNLGGYTDGEITRMLSESSIPFYGFGFDTGTKEGLDGLGAIARQSGGQVAIVSADSVKETFFQVYGATQEVWVANFTTDNNRIETERQTLSLVVKEGGENKEIKRQVTLRHWQPDQTIPKAVSITQKDEKNLEITFSEAVSGAGDISGYEISKEDGTSVAILSASYDQIQKKVWLSLAEALPQTAITVKFKGITDISMEENPVPGSLELLTESKETTVEQTQKDEKNIPASPQNMAAWYVLTIATVAVITAVAVSAMRRKNQKNENQDSIVEECKDSEGIMEFSHQMKQGGKVRFTDIPVAEIRLQVIFQNGESQMLILPIRGSIFVGRSEICEICLEDRDLSRQHFVIEERNGCFSITNLSETNGTRVNGILLQNPRNLQAGDVIEAGQERFTFFGGGDRE